MSNDWKMNRLILPTVRPINISSPSLARQSNHLFLGGSTKGLNISVNHLRFVFLRPYFIPTRHSVDRFSEKLRTGYATRVLEMAGFCRIFIEKRIIRVGQGLGIHDLPVV